MEAIARVKNLRGSARKVRLVLDLIRGRSVPEVKSILLFSNKKAAVHVRKLLKSAIANAKVKDPNVDVENMILNKAFANDGPIMKRHKPRAQGRATIIRKRTCHITLGISDKK